MRKILLILFLVPLIPFGLLSQDPGEEPTISLQRSDAPALEILEAITAQTGLNFSYNSRTVDMTQRISVSFINTGLNQALGEIAADLGVEHQIIENQIVLYVSAKSREKQRQSFTLSGFINDRNSGESLIGATVSKSGTRVGTVSNAFGFYSLSLERGAHALDYSYVGYQPVDLQLDLDQATKRNLSLQPTAIDLPDVVVEKQAPNILSQQDLDEMEILPGELNAMPEFAGESGIVKG